MFLIFLVAIFSVICVDWLYAPLVQVRDDVALCKAKRATHFVKGDLALLLKVSDGRNGDFQDFSYFSDRK